MDTTRASRLGSVPLFRALPPDRLEHIAAHTRPRRVPRGTPLLRAGHTHHTLFLIELGRITIGRTAADGRTGILSIAGPGDVVGLDALLGNPSPHDALAQQRMPVLAIEAAPLQDALRTDAAFAADVARHFASHAHQMAAVAEDLLTRSVQARLASRLCDLADRHGARTARGSVLPYPLRHEHLAAHIGVTRETVTRTIGAFRRAGFIGPGRSASLITDLHGLRQVAQS